MLYIYLIKNNPIYQNKTDDLATSLISVYQKIPVYRKFRYIVLPEKSCRHTNIGFNTDIQGVPNDWCIIILGIYRVSQKKVIQLGHVIVR